MVGSRAAGYASVNVKIRARKAKLLSFADYDRVIQVGSLEEGIRAVIGIVAPSELAEALAFLLTSGRTLDLLEIDGLFNRSFVAVHTKLAEMCPADTKHFLELYAKRYEFDNLKTILKAIHQGIPRDEIRGLIVPSISGTDEELAELIGVESVAQLCETLQDELAKNAVLGAMDVYSETSNTLPLELALDRALYQQLWDTISTLPKGERLWASRLVGMRIDLLNMLSILRGVQIGLDPSALRQFIIPVTYRLKHLESAMESTTPLEVIRLLSVRPYETLGNQIREILEENRSLAEAEQLVDAHLTRENARVFMGYPFHIGTVLAFLNLLSTEFRNLKSVLVGMGEDIPHTRLRESLVFVQ